MNVFTSPRFRLGWFFIVFGLVNSLFWTGYRWNFENHLNRAQITLDYEDTRALADAYGVSQLSLLKSFRERGATSLAVYQQSLNNFRDNGKLAIEPRELAQKLFPQVNWAQVPAAYRYLIVIGRDQQDGSSLADQIFPRLVEQDAAVPPRRIALPNSTSNGLPTDGILLPATRELFSDAQLGFDRSQLALAKKAGYTITARLSNTLNITPKRLERVFSDIEYVNHTYVPCHVVIFSEDSVVGYMTLIPMVAREMRQHGLIFTNIEFGKQLGADEFAKMSEGMMARVHSVNGDEASKMKMEALVDRYVRAARERDIRVLYVRLIRQLKGEAEPIDLADPGAKPKLLVNAYTQNLDFINEVSTELERQPLPFAFMRSGMEMGEAQPFTDYPLHEFEAHVSPRTAKVIRYFMIFFSGFATVGCVLLMLNLVCDFSPARRRQLAIWGVVIIAILSLSTGWGAKLIAQPAGSLFTVVALLWCGLPLVWDGLAQENGEPVTVARASLLGLKILIKATLITLIGGFTIVAVLNNWHYMSKADEFWGKRLTQFVPILLVALAYMGEMFPHRVEQNGAAPGRKLLASRINRALEQPFDVRAAVVCLILGIGVYIWMARFGNDSGMEISPLELRLRTILEKVFITRPRTKEIALGQPALLFTVYFLLHRRKFLGWFVLILATIGQTDVLNTMCHIHTPLFYSLWRTGTGLFLGAFLGYLALLAYTAVADRFTGGSQGIPASGGSGTSDGLAGLGSAAMEA